MSYIRVQSHRGQKAVSILATQESELEAIRTELTALNINLTVHVEPGIDGKVCRLSFSLPQARHEEASVWIIGLLQSRGWKVLAADGTYVHLTRQ